MQRDDRQSIGSVLQRFRWVRQLVGAERTAQNNLPAEMPCDSRKVSTPFEDPIGTLYASLSSCYDAATHIVELMRSAGQIVVSKRDGKRPVPMLVVEFADNDSDLGRLERAIRLGIPEFWRFRTADGSLEIYCDPAGSAYQTRQRVWHGVQISPPGAIRSIAIADALP